MEAIVLAGGLGTRLRSVVPDLPKPMAPVAGRPFLEILIGSLAGKGFERVVLSLGYMAETVTGHFGNEYMGVRLDYVVEDEPLGTGGAARLAMERCLADHVFVFNGDTFLDLEAGELEGMWRRDRRPIVVGREVPDTSRYGRLAVEDGRIKAFAKKGVAGPGLINAGCYVLPRDILAGFPPGCGFSIETDFFEPTVGRMAVDVFVTKGIFIDIGIPDDYSRAQELLARI
ncbi:MAG: nucleotidyltransferase family protein [Pseudodesulfovibrio sp.]|uniref:nucleotidyltransferase family protein n=1 Tax=Pseudodesulfovibrio sp. TaxID=2035812 RepID=UPI003D0ED11B